MFPVPPVPPFLSKVIVYILGSQIAVNVWLFVVDTIVELVKYVEDP